MPKSAALPLPMTRSEMEDRGWDAVDVVFVTGDAYVDHPSFAAALLGRVLEADGFRVGILAQPDWHSAAAWKIFGEPRLAFCVSAGNMDSMVNHYTANRKIRSEDAYSPGGKMGRRPDRATLSYCQRAREAFPGCVVLAGGIEASLRRLAHYDYWSDKVKRSMVLDSKCDLLIYGMGESPLVEILRRLRDGENIETIRDVRGTAYRLKQTEDLPEETEICVHLPSHEEVAEDKWQFSKMTRLIYENLNPFLDVTLVQEHAREAVVVNPPSLPLSEVEMDRIYGLPFTRLPHPSYGNQSDPKNRIPAFEVVKNSIQCHRGCFGGCTFCSLAAHQGKIIQSRSAESIVAEAQILAARGPSRGGNVTLSDLGGPTANMYGLGCKNADAQKLCRRISCLAPEICGNLNTDHSPVLELMRKIRDISNIDRVFIASGVRTDLAMQDPRYVDELARFHVGGHLKTAPEHTDPKVLGLMNKPPIEIYDQFCERFAQASEKAGKKQSIVPYLIAGFPGTTLRMMADTAQYLKRNGIHAEQVQEFIPAPFEWATSIYYTGINPATGQQVYVAKKLRERRLQKALLMYDDPNCYYDVKSALVELGREDLIGDSPDCLIVKYPPKSLALRRGSKVKRFQKQNERDKKAKTERREAFEEQARRDEERRLLERQQERQQERRGEHGGHHNSRKGAQRTGGYGTAPQRQHGGDFDGKPPRRDGKSKGPWKGSPKSGGKPGGTFGDRKSFGGKPVRKPGHGKPFGKPGGKKPFQK